MAPDLQNKGFAQNHHSTNGGEEPWDILGNKTIPSRGFMEICYQHLQFNQVPITMHSSDGIQFTRWVDGGMPRIPTEILGSVFYLYKTREDAELGSDYGGTGFFIGISSKIDSRYAYVYAVTNYHTVFENGYTTIRINTVNGTPDFLELIPDIDWKYIPGGGDVTVCPIHHLKSDYHAIKLISIRLFATKNIVDDKNIGIGDDVFMVGRFIRQDGAPTDSPAVRFGNISVMPARIEPMSNGIKDSYCIDLHSRSGFSGSPVWVYRTPGNDIETSMHAGHAVLGGGFMYFLGIHWGQFPELWEITDRERLKEASSGLIPAGKYIKGVSGMTCVMPPEPILEALNIPQLEEQRRQNDITLATQFKIHGYPPELETAKEPIPDTENPQHKEDFNSLVSAAVKKKPQDD
jgi:hypothetical protein